MHQVSPPPPFLAGWWEGRGEGLLSLPPLPHPQESMFAGYMLLYYCITFSYPPTSMRFHLLIFSYLHIMLGYKGNKKHRVLYKRENIFLASYYKEKLGENYWKDVNQSVTWATPVKNSEGGGGGLFERKLKKKMKIMTVVNQKESKHFTVMKKKMCQQQI